MLTFTKVDQPYILGRAAEATGSTGWAADATGFIAVDRSDPEEPREVAVAVFQRFEGKTGEFHFAMLGQRITREVMRTFLWIAFHGQWADLDRVIAIIPEDNKTAQVAALKAGFEFEHRKRAGIVGGRDAIVLSMGNPARATARLPKDDEE